MNHSYPLKLLAQVDEAGPLWLLFEGFLEWLGFWGRIALAFTILLAFLVLIALMARRKS
jgi:hypothetical protein